MATLTLEQWTEIRDSCQSAILKVLTGGQSTTAAFPDGARTVARADLAELRQMLTDAEAHISRLAGGGGVRVRRAIPL